MIDWQPYREHYARTLTGVSPTLRGEVARLGMAPFTSAPETTLHPGELMVVSMKPYGAADQSYRCGWDERADRPDLHRWYDGERSTGNFVREADALLALLIDGMTLHLRPRQIFSTYAYFSRARDAAELKRFGLELLDCSAFHRKFLQIIRPRVVLCIGNGPLPSAFALYRSLYGPEHVEEVRCAPRVLLRHFTTSDGVLVLGVPHLSYVRVASFATPLFDVLRARQHKL
ncbi:hypothetical protein GGR28_001980 [Lewinella aquimaris]|uniref:Uracil DNA glycosylase superfamily protein n=1 Tax=Neolewinella aquimaris TaxID=1835722 RepID=A0A840E2N5_9BACT|nr:hypothetical protein [Neolewinella aquimaris]MBB4079360.1 hypothetical protein [Neolewinella aquimaris]